MNNALQVLAINSGSSSLKLGLYRVQRRQVHALWADDAVRNAICSRLVGIGLSKRQVRVLPSQEDEQIARHTWALIDSGG